MPTGWIEINFVDFRSFGIFGEFDFANRNQEIEFRIFASNFSNGNDKQRTFVYANVRTRHEHFEF